MIAREPNRSSLTPREFDALVVVVHVWTAASRGATLGEIGETLGVSRARAHAIVGSLRDLGMVEHAPTGSRRGAVPTEAGEETSRFRVQKP